MPLFRIGKQGELSKSSVRKEPGKHHFRDDPARRLKNGKRMKNTMANEFTKRIYEVVQQIPRGCVASYGQVAALAGNPRGARGVGFALHRNPRPGEIPCHRVVFRDGSLCSGFAFGGEGAQRALLAAEDVAFLPDGRVDLQKCAWLGAPRAREKNDQ